MFSFGIDERLNQETNQLAGYSMPVCLWQREEEPALEEKKFFDGMNNLLSICRNYLQEEYGHELASLLCDIFYYKQIEYKDKKKKKKKDETAAPVLYAKLIYSHKSTKVLSLFRTKGNDKVNPFDCFEQYWHLLLKVFVCLKILFLLKSKLMMSM